ncbi:MAG: hypothetical protein IKV47_03720 [Oscillospiraceae bacterium]|nr:hypothetical protein [Oscillospiraceae bacterium]MBR5261261.1 hypothetical protein [Oscillospiraceae bacterium]
MMTVIRDWIISLASSALLCAVLTEITPEGKVKTVQRTVCGIVMAVAFFSPLLNLRYESCSVELASYEKAAAAINADGEKIADTLSRKYIEQECAAYILDKAQTFGCDASGAEVQVRWSSRGVWYPVSAEIYASYNSRLASSVSANLGIAEENIKWSGNENSRQRVDSAS